ncbi:toxin glutamine deamidase domain-containing protein [Streptomyces sp. SCSIO 75703]|uniref:putative T7SS-secreted protein n=1 Tax=unclassified Streptomyces TaxID=2593676 RepID=UPI0004C1DC9E|nr:MULTISPECIES: toxin glutamine deamidase domain-containing protein [unclassified Streptomyces]
MGVLDDLDEGLGKLKDGVNRGLTMVEHGVDVGKKVLGEGVDWGTDQIGAGLERVGLEGVADTVEDWGDEIASGLGATPREQQLGQTEEAEELVHGKPDRIRTSASHLRDFSTAFDSVGSGLKTVDSSGWRGEGGDAFREKFGVHPNRWLRAADACETAAAALESYADTVEWAQRQAADAIALYRQGKRASEEAIEAYDRRIEAYNAKVRADQDPGPTPAPFHDPGKENIRQAREKLADARAQRDAASFDAEGSIRKALTHAPAKPPPLERIGNDLVDGIMANNLELTHAVGGVLKGTAGLVNFARGLNPVDPYNLTHPAEYLQNVSLTLAGLVSTVAQPERALNTAVDSFRQDPSEFIGRLVPEVIGSKGAGVARGGLRLAAKEAAEAGARKTVPKGAKHVDGIPKDWSDLARSTDHVKERAIHYDSVDPKKAQEFLDSEYPWLKDINNTGMPGYTDNCSHNVVTLDRRMDGIEVGAAPKDAGGHIPPEHLGLKDRAPGQYDWVSSYDDVIRDLQARGDGARSVVYIARPNGSAHVFNAVNTRHGVVFLDGQSGTLGLLERDVTHIGHIPYRDGAS